MDRLKCFVMEKAPLFQLQQILLFVCVCWRNNQDMSTVGYQGHPLVSKIDTEFDFFFSYIKFEVHLLHSQNEQRHEKTNILHMRKQRSRSAPLFSLHR